MLERKWGKYPDGCQDAFRIREDVFIREQGFSNEFDEIDQSCDHLTVYRDGVAIGCARLYQEADGSWHIGRIAVSKEARGTGIGAKIMEEAETHAIALGIRCIHLSAQVQAEGFYQKMGYHTVTDPYLDEHCPHVGMEKHLRDI